MTYFRQDPSPTSILALSSNDADMWNFKAEVLRALGHEVEAQAAEMQSKNSVGSAALTSCCQVSTLHGPQYRQSQRLQRELTASPVS